MLITVIAGSNSRLYEIFAINIVYEIIIHNTATTTAAAAATTITTS